MTESNFINLYILVVEIPVMAWKDLWIIGDQFIHQIYHTLQELNVTTKLKKGNIPYIYDMYNVKCFTANPLSEIKNVAACLVNALTKALNDAEKLPRLIIVAPDWDLINYINIEHFEADAVINEVLAWILMNMKRAIKSKQDFLLKKRAGAVAENEPKLIWVKMINRFGSTTKYDRSNAKLRALALKGKFNRILEDRLADEQSHYIMDVNMAVNDGQFFTPLNELNGDGRVRYWEEFIEQIKLFDFKQLTLKPLRKDTATRPEYNQRRRSSGDDYREHAVEA